MATIRFGRDFGFSPIAGTVTVDIVHFILSRRNRGLGKLPLHAQSPEFIGPDLNKNDSTLVKFERKAIVF
jgi:hypothetical protein